MTSCGRTGPDKINKDGEQITDKDGMIAETRIKSDALETKNESSSSSSSSSSKCGSRNCTARQPQKQQQHCACVSRMASCRLGVAPAKACIAVAPGKAHEEEEEDVAPGMALAVAPGRAQDVEETLVDGETPATGGASSSGDNALSQGKVTEIVDEPDADVEEARVAKGLVAPARVTKQEREEHERTHMPYRAWCEFCVRGRGKKMAHRSKDDDEKAMDEIKVPRVSMDYFFMSAEDQKAHQNPIIVMVDESTGDKYARAVAQKGLGKEKEMEWLVKDMQEELQSWGHTGGAHSRLILKSDNEKAIIAVRDALAKMHGGLVTVEAPARGESQSNGMVEEAGKTIREFARVYKEQIEAKAEMKLKPTDLIIPWAIRWSAMATSRFLVGKDGRTAFERKRGRPCHLPTIPFGERVWFHEARPHKERRNKFDSECHEGVWLGHTRNSNEALVGTAEGVVRAYSIRRQEDDRRWSSKMIHDMRGSPQQPDPKKEGSHVPVRIHFDPPSTTTPLPSIPARQEKAMRRMMITPAMLTKYGYTDGCEACRLRAAGSDRRAEHSEACRKGLEEAMSKEEGGRERLKKDQDRVNRRMAEQVEEEERVKDAEVRGPDVEEKDERPADAQEQVDGEAKDDDIDMPEVSENEVQGESERKRDLEDDREDDRTAKRRREDEDKGPDPETDMIRSLLRISHDLAEWYSPPRVTEEAVKHGLRPGAAMDLTNGWDFRRADHRQKAREYQQKYKPRVVIGSPMCTMFSALQNLSPWTLEKERRWTEAREHIKFMMEIYMVQIREGRWFLHEHPAGATSWALDEVVKVMSQEGVEVTTADQCMYGLLTWDRSGRPMNARARKRTKFMTNCKEIGDELQRKCDGSHEHQHLMEGRARDAARYPEGLCRAICKGICAAIRNQKMGVKKLIEVGRLCKINEKAAVNDHEEENYGEYAVDDLTGKTLDAREVMRARMKEVGYIQDKKVWRNISRTEARAKGYKIIQTRWIDINKGDDENPKYRSRFVGKEFNDGVEDGLFAATPPLEALRLLISDAATKDSKEEKVIMVNDVARAFFEAPINRYVCVELPDEMKTEKDEVGLLQMSLYGTRDAAANFQAEVRKFIVKAGFNVGKYNPATYYHPGKKIRTLVHGDDFISSGGRENVEWFRSRV